MAELDLIAPLEEVSAAFDLEPAFNAISDLTLLDVAENTSGFSEWVYLTAGSLAPERLQFNRLVLNVFAVAEHLAGESWPSFPAWVEHLSTKDPEALRDVALDRLSHKAGEVLEQAISPGQLLHDRSLFLSSIEQMLCGKGRSLDPALWERAHALLNDPLILRDQIVIHLRAMWDEVLAAEWARSRPMLEEVVAAFGTLDLGGLSGAELIHRVTGRDLPSPWDQWQPGQQIVFVPSPHIGPYIVRLYRTDLRAWTAFRAHIPEGVPTRSAALTRSELLMRLSALADDTRLRILELLSHHDALNAQDIMGRLGLSQSSASRHLSQLSASGYLTAERHEGVKWYRLNRGRIDDTLRSLKEFL